MGAKVIPIPAENGGAAPGADRRGVLHDPRAEGHRPRYATSAKIVSCLSSGNSIVATDNTLNYIAPTKAGAAGPGGNRCLAAVLG